MVASRKKKNAIEQQLADFEARLRRDLLKQKLAALHSDEAIKDSLDQGAMPQIHVSVGQLAASRPPVQPRVSGD